MAAFATMLELELFMGADFDAQAEQRASMLLNLATQTIKNYTGQTLEKVTAESVTFDPPRAPWYRSVFLPQLPVTAVASVTVDGVAQVHHDDYEWTEGGELRLVSWSWGTVGDSIVVVYTHGYPTIPDDVKAVCLQVVERSYSNPGGLRSESIGAYSYTAATAETGSGTGLGLNDDEKAILDAYRPLVLA